MKKSLLLLPLVAAIALAVRLSIHPGDATAGNLGPHKASTSVTISARVDEFAEWSDPSPVIIEADWSGPINKVNQHQTVSHPLTLYTNTDTTITAKPALNNGILTLGSSTLDTAYKLTGAVTPADPRFKPAAEFFAGQNVYTVLHTSGTGSYNVTLEVEITSPPTEAPEKGLYTCGLILTAEW